MNSNLNGKNYNYSTSISNRGKEKGGDFQEKEMAKVDSSNISNYSYITKNGHKAKKSGIKKWNEELG